MFLDGKHGLPLVDINEGDDECQDDGNASNNASDHCTYVDTVAVVVVLFWLNLPFYLTSLRQWWWIWWRRWRWIWRRRWRRIWR